MKMLFSVFPEVNWSPLWFPKNLTPTFWRKKDHQLHFLKSLAFQYNLNSETDWKRVSSTLIVKHGGKVDLVKN